MIFEWLGPIIEFIAILAISASIYLGLIDTNVLYTIIGFGISYSAFLSLASIHIEENNYAHHHTKSDIFIYLLTSIIENIGYRQLNWWWRFSSMISMPFTKRQWIVNQRQEIHHYKKDVA